MAALFSICHKQKSRSSAVYSTLFYRMMIDGGDANKATVAAAAAAAAVTIFDAQIVTMSKACFSQPSKVKVDWHASGIRRGRVTNTRRILD